ncbi:MAG: IclR family transcriptional regulator [Hyphomonadaceae bacterium]
MGDEVIKSAGRVLSIFEYFAAVQSPASVSEISRRLSIPQSSTSILLSDLHRLGYLDHDMSTREYYPTIRLALVGQWVRREKLMEGRLMPLLESIRADTGETVILGFLNGNWTQYIHVLESSARIRLRFQIGTLRPSVLTSIGKTLLARKENDEILKVVRRYNADQGNETAWLNADAFLADIEETRARGYGETVESLTPGASMVAMEVPSGSAGVPMGIGVGARLDRMKTNKDQILATLRRRINDMVADMEMESGLPALETTGAPS